MITISALLFLVWSILNCSIYVAFFKEKFGRLITISFIGYTLLSYLSGLIFENVLYIPFYISIFAIIYIFVKLVKNKEERLIFKNNFCSVGLILYVALFIVLLIIQRNKTLGHVDDYMHWGLFIKDILEYNKFSATLNNPFTWFHSDYPPFMQIFESVFGSFGIKALSLSSCCFAFASIVGWSFYGIKALEFFTKKSVSKKIYTVIFLSVVPLSIVFSEDLVWILTDLFNSMMLIPNCCLLLCFGGDVVAQLAKIKKVLEIKSIKSYNIPQRR